MKHLPSALALAFVALGSTSVRAAEKTVKLAVPGMYCASCPYIVRSAISAVDGVKSVVTVLEDRIATVVFDDDATSLELITRATIDVGYKSSLLETIQGS